jgi:fluoroquinolone resistance protein
MEKLENNETYFACVFNKLLQPSSELSGCEFEECEFNECDFSAATFKSCKFINCLFTGCNLSLLQIPYSFFFEVSFVECKLLGIDWTRASWPAFNLDSEIRFSQSILNNSSFFGLTLNGLQFDRCKLHEVDFRDGNFANSAMTSCDFSNSLFMHTNLESVDFSESFNFNIDVLQNRVAKAKFSRYEALSLLQSLGIELQD